MTSIMGLYKNNDGLFRFEITWDTGESEIVVAASAQEAIESRDDTDRHVMEWQYVPWVTVPEPIKKEG